MPDLTGPVGSVLASLGFSAAAGLNAWIPLLAVGLLGRAGELSLDGSYEALQSNTGLAAVALLLVADFIGDKVPAVDSVVHAIGTVVSPASGAVVFGAGTDAPTDLPFLVAAATGAVPAGLLHVLRMTARPFFTVGTLGFANPFVSLAEDGTSVALVLVAVVVPVLAALFAFLVLVGLVVAARRVTSRARAR